VRDPFYKHMPAHFNMTFKELLAAKHPSAWLEFEKGRISQDEFELSFFADGRSYDREGLRQRMVRFLKPPGHFPPHVRRPVCNSTAVTPSSQC
jgi:hypothetical protein